MWGEATPPTNPNGVRMEDTKTTLDLKSVLNIDPPKDFKVIYMNDDVTTFDFVSGSLVRIFDYDEDPAQQKAVEINNNGSGVVALLPFEIAEQKGVEVLLAARNHGYPLQVRIEQE